MNRNSNLAIVVILAIIVALVIAFIVTANDDDNNGDTNNNTEITNNDDQNDDQDDELDTVDSLNDVLNEDSTDEEVEDVSYNIDMDHLSFSPSTISAKPGQTVNLTLTSSDEIHDFVLDEFNANSGLVSAGGEKTYSFTIPANAEPGNYEFYCSVGSHRQLGMVGTLTVGL